MTILPGRLPRLPIFRADNPKGPWGAGGNDGNGGDGKPPNPWSPPAGRAGANKPSALDEFLKRARGGAAGFGGGGSGGEDGLPGAPNARALWSIVAALVIAAWLVLTSVHPIGPQQRGVVTYFGRYATTLEPGVRVTLPAPIATVTKVDVQNINTEDFPADGAGENLMLTGDQNIVDLAFSVRWDIKDPQDYIFQIANPQDTVRATAESAMRAVIATTTLDDAIGAGRGEIENRVQDLMQSILDRYNSGVRIQGVAIKQAAPPQAVMDDFKAVSAAQQEAQANINNARGYAQQIIAHAQGEAAAFDKVYAQYKLAPEVTRRRMYYETMEDVLSKTDKTIVEAPGVVPYLPLPPGSRAAPDATPAAPGGGQ